MSSQSTNPNQFQAPLMNQNQIPFQPNFNTFSQQPYNPYLATPTYPMGQNYQQPPYDPNQIQNPQNLQQNLNSQGVSMQQQFIGNPNDIRTVLNQITSVATIKDPDFLMLVCGCKQEAKYNVYQKQNNQYVEALNTRFLYAQESSSFILWCLLPNVCREYQVAFNNAVGNNTQQYILIEKKFSLTFLCFNWPESLIYLVDNGQKIYLGKIVFPFNLCSFVFKIYDKNNQEILFWDGSCFQMGILFRCPLDSCNEASFKESQLNNSANEKVFKTGNGILNNCLTDSNKIFYSFDNQNDWETKALIISALQTVDFSTFAFQAVKYMAVFGSGGCTSKLRVC